MTVLYLEDFAVGQTFGSGRLRVDRERIKSFAAEFDPQPFHLDETAALELDLPGTGGQRMAYHRTHDANSWLTASSNLPVASSAWASRSCAGRGRYGRGMNFASRAKCLPCGHRSHAPREGLVKVRTTTLNQDGAAVQVFTANLLVQRRPPQALSPSM